LGRRNPVKKERVRSVAAAVAKLKKAHMGREFCTSRRLGDRVVVTCGSAMSLYGLRDDIRDLDVFAPAYREQRYEAEPGKYGPFEIDMWSEWRDPHHEHRLIDKALPMQDVWVAHPQSIIDFYEELKRPQDAEKLRKLKRLTTRLKQNPGMNRYPWMALADTEAFVPLMERTGTSKVARSYRGFYTAFQKAGGDPKKMGRTHRDTPGRGDSYMWWERRNEFVSRHMGQVEKRGEKLWKPNGNPTKRHLGLIAWAYTPDPDGVDDWLARNAKGNPLNLPVKKHVRWSASRGLKDMMGDWAEREGLTIRETGEEWGSTPSSPPPETWAWLARRLGEEGYRIRELTPDQIESGREMHAERGYWWPSGKLGRGAFGVVYPLEHLDGSPTGLVVKITGDPAEVAVAHRLKGYQSSALPRIEGAWGIPGGWWMIVREDVTKTCRDRPSKKLCFALMLVQDTHPDYFHSDPRLAREPEGKGFDAYKTLGLRDRALVNRFMREMKRIRAETGVWITDLHDENIRLRETPDGKKALVLTDFGSGSGPAVTVPIAANPATDLAGRHIPEKYLAGLTKKQRRARIRELTESREGRRGYKELPTDIEARKKGLVKRSPYIVEAKRRGIDHRGQDFEDTARRALRHYGVRANKKNVRAVAGSLSRVFDKGLAAWQTGGHRPGASQGAWAYARVASFLVGGKTVEVDRKEFAALPQKMQQGILSSRVVARKNEGEVELRTRASPSSFSVAAYLGGKHMGMLEVASVRPRNLLRRVGKKVVIVEEAFLSSKLRGKGIGSRMYKAAADWAASNGFTFASNSVIGEETTDAAAAVWLRMGAREAKPVSIDGDTYRVFYLPPAARKNATRFKREKGRKWSPREKYDLARMAEEKLPNGAPRYYFTMHDFPKVGIDPKPRNYDNPVGVYAFPLIPEYLDKLNTGRLPYMSELKYVSVLEATEPNKMLAMLPNEFYGFRNPDIARLFARMEADPEWQAQVRRREEEQRRREATPQETYKRTLRAAQPCKSVVAYDSWELGSEACSIKTSKVLRDAGSTSVVDMGTHQMSPRAGYQAVFLTPKAYRVVETFYTPNLTGRSRSNPASLEPLPYEAEALEPVIDAETVRLHHGKHQKGYVEGFNRKERRLDEVSRRGKIGTDKSRSDMYRSLYEGLTFNGAGVMLHEMYWENLEPKGGTGRPARRLVQQVRKDFGSMENLQQQMTDVGSAIRGSGWVILAWAPRFDRLVLLPIQEHEMRWLPGAVPLLVFDVWEHAYYKKYGPGRREYLDRLWSIINWTVVNERFGGSR
jgi:Fe-Mn family superoxide dismutase